MRFLKPKCPLSRDCSGATSIEYALIAGLIALSIIIGARALGGNLTLYYNNIAANIT